MSKLLEQVQTKVLVRRGGEKKEVLIEEIVSGDVILLSAGDIIPADCVILTAKDFFVNEAILTGETFPVEKIVIISSEGSLITQRKNCVFKGTNVESGSATILAIKTGSATEIGKIADRLGLKVQETDFERGVRRFGYLLMEVTLIFYWYLQ